MAPWQWAVLVVISCLRAALSCSTAVFDRAFDAYLPFPCATACLACPDADYRHNFANTCNYTDGSCCKSQYHTAIASSWECVATYCDAAAARDAFAVFEKHCTGVGIPLAEQDIPPRFKKDSSGSSGTPRRGRELCDGELKLTTCRSGTNHPWSSDIPLVKRGAFVDRPVLEFTKNGLQNIAITLSFAVYYTYILEIPVLNRSPTALPYSQPWHLSLESHTPVQPVHHSPVKVPLHSEVHIL